MKSNRTLRRALVFISPLLVSSAWSEGGPGAGVPTYPLYAIVSGNARPTRQDLEVLARSFTLAQARFSPEIIQTLHEINPDFKIVHYFNSTYTSSVEDAPIVEQRFRRALAMFRVGTLADPVDATATELRLVSARKGMPLSLRASTVEGDVSSGDRERPSTRHYVTWIRIDDEMMRLEAVDPATGRVTVTRGFDDSPPDSHAAGAPVFSPIYLGSVNDTGAWPGGPGGYLRYSFDPANPAGTQWRLEQMSEVLELGYDGFWLDICSASAFNMADADGKGVKPWDFRSGRVYDGDAYCEGQQIKVHTIQNAILERIGRWPVMCANNMKARSFETGSGGQRLMLMPTAAKPRPLDGYCIENYAGGFAPRAARRKESEGPTYHPVEEWRENQIMLMKCAQEGLPAFPMIANAGSKSVLLEGLGPIRDQFEAFAWASYLLCVEKDAPTRLGLPAFYREGERRFARLHERYTWPIGAPAQTVAPDEIDRYRTDGHLSYARRFSNGLVLVNPADKDDETIDLKQSYIDPETSEVTTSVRMKAHTGRMLLRDDGAK